MLTRNQVADFFLLCADEEAGDVITHLKLQKLVYYAQAWHLALNEGEALLDEEFEAWAHGPVCVGIYDRFKGLGFSPIPLSQSATETSEFGAYRSYLEEIWRVYGGYSAKQLETFTHNEQPWIEARGNAGPMERSNAVISRQTMRSYYSSKLSEQEQTQ